MMATEQTTKIDAPCSEYWGNVCSGFGAPTICLYCGWELKDHKTPSAPRMADFDWPCDLREAHGPHPASRIVQPGLRTDSRYRQEYDCPGVRAYPTTMIGGAYR